MSAARPIALAVGVVAVIGLPLAGVASMRAMNAFVWLCITFGFCALYAVLAGFRRESGMLVPLLVLAPAAPIGLWLALDPTLSAFASWRPWALVAASGLAGWVLGWLSPAMSMWRADRRTQSAVRHARENIEKLVERWGIDIARPYAHRPELPSRVRNLG